MFFAARWHGTPNLKLQFMEKGVKNSIKILAKVTGFPKIGTDYLVNPKIKIMKQVVVSHKRRWWSHFSTDKHIRLCIKVNYRPQKPRRDSIYTQFSVWLNVVYFENASPLTQINKMSCPSKTCLCNMTTLVLPRSGSLTWQLCGRYRRNLPLKINYSCIGIK